MEKKKANFVRGCYAVSVNEELNAEAKEDIKDKNIRYINRNRQETR